jgi:hypothetical protein
MKYEDIQLEESLLDRSREDLLNMSQDSIFSVTQPKHIMLENTLFRAQRNIDIVYSKDANFASVFMILCFTFGSGILALPYSIAQVGIISGIFLYFLSAGLIYWTYDLLIKSGFKANIINYGRLIDYYFGTVHFYTYEMINLISSLGVNVVYTQISN